LRDTRGAVSGAFLQQDSLFTSDLRTVRDLGQRIEVCLRMTMSQETPPEHRSRPSRAWLLILIGVVAGVAGERLVVPSKSETERATPAVPPAPFTRVGDRIIVPETSLLRTQLAVEPAAARDVARELVLPAMVEADPARTVNVMPPVTGRVIDLMAQLGGRVTKGEQLAVIDSSDLAQALSDEEKARSALKLTKQTLDRLMVLEKTSAIAVKDREQAQSDYAQAVSELDRADARLRAIGAPLDAKANSRLLSVKSPIAGSVIALQVAPGAYVNDPTAAMMTIANLDVVWVTANVPEKDVSFVYPGQTVKVAVASYPGRALNGKVLFVSDVIEPDTRRNKVRIEFQNKDKALKPNMFATVTFVAPPVTQITVPNSALLMTNDKTSVFVEVESWAFERRIVEISYQEGTATAIKSGLRTGDRVVVKGAVRLND
jgi:membrane fusion protein, heavy metal efflux system